MENPGDFFQSRLCREWMVPREQHKPDGQENLGKKDGKMQKVNESLGKNLPPI